MNCAAPHCPGLGQIWEQTFEWGERSGEKKVKTVKNCFFKKLAQDTHSGAIPRGWEMQLFPSHAQITCRSLKEGSACIPTWGRGTAGFSEEENGQSHVFTGSFLLLFRQDFGQFNSFFPFFFFFSMRLVPALFIKDHTILELLTLDSAAQPTNYWQGHNLKCRARTGIWSLFCWAASSLLKSSLTQIRKSWILDAFLPECQRY